MLMHQQMAAVVQILNFTVIHNFGAMGRTMINVSTVAIIISWPRLDK
jgi:hypothetical protein